MAILHQEIVVDINSDCAEFCPYHQAFDLLLVGTYLLNEQKNIREGQLELYALNQRIPELRATSACDLPGVFDVKWQRSASGSLSATLAAADGALWVVPVKQLPELGTSAAMTSSGGQIAVLQPGLLYSGADDSMFKCWDLRAGTGSPVFSNRKAHGAGVCCITTNPHKEGELLTGSYDEQARLWDTRNISRPVMQCQVDGGGGVWRLKRHPTDPELLLAAVMYGGAALLRHDGARGELEVVERYKGHGSITYGADWYRGNVAEHVAGRQLLDGDAGRCLVATCSFYDRLLHLWSPGTRAQGMPPACKAPFTQDTVTSQPADAHSPQPG